RIRFQGTSTWVAQNGQVITLTPGREPAWLRADSCGLIPSFDVNDRGRYWISQGRLLRDGRLGPELIGEVLAGQTLFWVGPTFGFGFYRAGQLHVAFVFDALRRGIKDTVKLPPLPGQLIAAECCFSADHCWFFAATQNAGKT